MNDRARGQHDDFPFVKGFCEHPCLLGGDVAQGIRFGMRGRMPRFPPSALSARSGPGWRRRKLPEK